MSRRRRREAWAPRAWLPTPQTRIIPEFRREASAGTTDTTAAAEVENNASFATADGPGPTRAGEAPAAGSEGADHVPRDAREELRLEAAGRRAVCLVAGIEVHSRRRPWNQAFGNHQATAEGRARDGVVRALR